MSGATAPVMILAGGTGGHVFPALAVAEELRGRGVDVVWMGTARGLEARVVPAAGIGLICLRVAGLRRRGLAGWLMAPWILAAALARALAAVRRYHPRAVLGMGGYAAGPGALAAWLLRRPLLIHEQNAVPGLTNRLLARLARRVMTGFTGPFAGRPNAEYTGNPVRRALTELPPPEQRLAGRSGALRVLVIGGSLGALALNRQVPAAVALLPAEQRPVIRHQAGERTLEQARAAYRDAGVEAAVVPFIEDMAEAFTWADLVVCRAGALTVAELAAAGVAAILVPLPQAVDDHQTANARYLAEADAAVLIPQAQLTAQRLAETLSALAVDRRRLQAMAARARALGRPDATRRVAELCLEVAS